MAGSCELRRDVVATVPSISYFFSIFACRFKNSKPDPECRKKTITTCWVSPSQPAVTKFKKAYRKAARKFHPDLHADKDERERERAKQKFQKIQQAYDVLSDPEKRRMYDQLGPGFENMSGGHPFGGQQFGNAGGGFDFSQIFGNAGPGGGGGGFEQIFRQMGGMGGGPGGRPPRPSKGQDLEQEITIPFSVSVLGGQHQLNFQRRSGKIETIDVKIPAGIESNKKIRLRGQGGMSDTGGPNGDLLVVVKVAPHPSFTRKRAEPAHQCADHFNRGNQRRQNRLADTLWSRCLDGPARQLQRQVVAS